MTTITDLNCRLLCACQVANDIKPDGTFTPSPPYYDTVGFIEEKNPTIIYSGTDACLVGTCSDCVIVAFRGTLTSELDPPSILDWLQDFLAFTISVDKLPGKVHEGFYSSVLSIWNSLLAEVKTQIAGGKPLFQKRLRSYIYANTLYQPSRLGTVPSTSTNSSGST